MAKKKDDNSDFLSELFKNFNTHSPKTWSKDEFKRIFSQNDPEKLSAKERMILIAAAICVQNDITPEAYTLLYKEAENNPLMRIMPMDRIFGDDNYDGSATENYFEDSRYDKAAQGLMSFPLPDAKNKSLILKIQLRDIKKPPLWREVKIPANMNFHDLHDVIQILFDWDNAHLWQFEKTPYSHGFTIGEKCEDMGFNDGPTDIAEQTAVTKVLKKAGDKMIYLYDFGDDWVHDITVKEVVDEKTECPVCLKWKGDNPIEDVGGIWGLQIYREMYDPAIKHTKKEVKEFLDNSWFETEKEFRDFMNDKCFNLEKTNNLLKEIKINNI